MSWHPQEKTDRLFTFGPSLGFNRGHSACRSTIACTGENFHIPVRDGALGCILGNRSGEHMERISTYRRTMDIEDLAGLVRLIVEQMVFIGYTHDSASVERFLANAMRPASNAVVFVGYDKAGRAVAFAFGNLCSGLECEGDYLWLNELYVSVAHRHEHIATALLDHAKAWAKEAGCVYMAMVTHPRNTAAQQLYGQAGFELEQLVWVDTYL